MHTLAQTFASTASTLTTFTHHHAPMHNINCNAQKHIILIHIYSVYQTQILIHLPSKWLSN